MAKYRKSKKRPRNSEFSVKGCFGNQGGSHASVFIEYPDNVRGISFWKIKGWREDNAKPKRALIM